MTTTVVVLDSVGVGALPDASDYGDAGAHTVDHVVSHTNVALHHLARAGLGCIDGVRSVPCATAPDGAFGRMIERSRGKDTTTGHWELMGVVVDVPFRTWTEFPPHVMQAFDAFTGRGHLGNVAASGTTILDQLGARHLHTGGDPIVYTSADSVFQVAAHVDVVPLATLYAWCEFARSILVGDDAVARVIARPFEGTPGRFVRLNGARRDFATPPPRTVLDAVTEAGRPIVSIGKIGDIFAHRATGDVRKTASDQEGIDETIRAMREQPHGLIFTNLVDFDAVYGHRRDVVGYAEALRRFDASLPALVASMGPEDLLLLASDHGNDPTWRGSDHTREHGLLVAFGPRAAGVDLGTRSSFADVGATVAESLEAQWTGPGRSFYGSLTDANRAT